MPEQGIALLQWLAQVEYELVLFAGTFFIIGAIDDLAMDGAWLWLRLTGRAQTDRIDTKALQAATLSGPAAVFVPAWDEARIIATTLRHMMAAWPHSDLRVYVGCYANDAATMDQVRLVAADDDRCRIVVVDATGPTSKADCLNHTYRAACDDELSRGSKYRMIVLQDAEDMVHPAALTLLDRAIEDAQFVQLPVLPAIMPSSRLVSGHYADEFADGHGRVMVVRSALGAALPGAGVGLAVDRIALGNLAAEKERAGQPFAADSLTEDYELGLSIGERGGRSSFIRARDETGVLVATRSFFPDKIGTAIRQKTRWLHGIAMQGWDRMGWVLSGKEFWMRLRDRRGPITAIVLVAAYLLIVVSCILMLAETAGLARPYRLNSAAETIVIINLVIFAWRAFVRFTFTTREYGFVEGLLSAPRIVVSNFIAISAAGRAIAQYYRSWRGAPLVWDKTDHDCHPAQPITTAATR